MPKKRLTDIAEEYGITFDKAHDIIVNKLEEDQVTGRGRNLWISERGQDIIEDLIPMVTIHRGNVISQAPNPRFVFVKARELIKKVPVMIPLALSGKLTSKVIYFEADHSGDNVKYKWIKAPQSQ
jgi:hypothetical protein|tara:strand:+ start:466 stop:840 length:375 start_codon:yes stop_codon:yes gene_type:complete